MQTSYPTNNPAAVPGMLKDRDDVLVEHFPASVAIPYGAGVELDATGLAVRLPLGTGATSPLFRGVAIYDAGDEPGGYAIGDVVRILRKGRIAVIVDAATVMAATDTGGVAGLDHSSTIATDRGKFTKTALNAVAGTEISDVGAKWAPGLPGTSAIGGIPMAWLELNLV
jgi:hypothetical protein